MTIIAATNFTELAENAVEYAAQAAQASKARLLLFNSFTLSIHAANSHLSGETFQNLLDRNIEILRKKSIVLSSKYGIEVIYHSAFSIIEEELAELIGKYSAELIVLGMTEKTLEQDLIGNTATAMIKNLDIPILVVPQKAKFEGTKKILFACDIANEVPDKVMSRIREVAVSLSGQVEVFSVNDQIESLKAQNSDALATNAIDKALEGINYYYKNVRSNAVIKEIEKEIKSFEADILIMVPKQYGFWSSIVHRSKTRIMAAGLDIPLLSIPVK